jgi:mediator of replication checkpoint protein 1
MSKARREPAVDRELVETYMEGEAEESDEEIAFGFAGPKIHEDEGADEEQAGEDGHIKDLVDDREMDQETQAKDKILEKVQLVQ